MISILLPCYKSDDVFMHVFRHSIFSAPTQIVYYDNGGNKAIREFVHDVQLRKGIDCVWLGDGQNIGLNAALNECAKHAKHPYYYLPHTDMLLLPGWDTVLLQHAKKYAPATYLFCSRSCEPTRGHTPFQLVRDYGQEPSTFLRKILLEDFKEYKDPGIVTAYRMPFFMHKALWKKMNGVDANLFSYATDDDLFFSAYHVGVRRFWMINQSLVYHLQGKSNQQQSVDRDSQKPYDYLLAKWGKLGYDVDGGVDVAVQRLIPWNIKVQ